MKKSALILGLALGLMGSGTGVVYAQLGAGGGEVSSTQGLVERANAALKAGKLDKAFGLYLKAAKKENPEAQNMVGKCYEEGLGVLQNDLDAYVWFKKSAGYGYPDGQNNLANCYMHGTGVPKDDFEAITYYHKAASHGSAAAAYNLGYCYETGYGLPRNMDAAKYFYHLAGKKGYTLALSRLRMIEK